MTILIISECGNRTTRRYGSSTKRTQEIEVKIGCRCTRAGLRGVPRRPLSQRQAQAQKQDGAEGGHYHVLVGPLIEAA
jgi:hypothetical protein